MAKSESEIVTQIIISWINKSQKTIENREATLNKHNNNGIQITARETSTPRIAKLIGEIAGFYKHTARKLRD